MPTLNHTEPSKSAHRMTTPMRLPEAFGLDLTGHYRGGSDATEEANRQAIRGRMQDRLERHRKFDASSSDDDEWLWLGIHEECQFCGERLVARVVDGTTIRLEVDEDRLAEMPRCPYETGVPPAINTIPVPSGQLRFTNFFKEFSGMPPGKEHDDAYSVGTIAGRTRRAAVLAAQGIGYGQTENTRLSVLRSPRHPERVVLTTIDPAEVEAYESISDHMRLRCARLVAEGYAVVQSFHCNMWRWMCADEQRVAATPLAPSNQELAPLDVPPGAWQITHHHGVEDDWARIVAELEYAGPCDAIPSENTAGPDVRPA